MTVHVLDEDNLSGEFEEDVVKLSPTGLSIALISSNTATHPPPVQIVES